MKCPVVRGVALATAEDDAGDDGSVGSSGSVTDSGRGASEEGDSAATSSSSAAAATATVAATSSSRAFPQQPCRHESIGLFSHVAFTSLNYAYVYTLKACIRSSAFMEIFIHQTVVA